ncbi:MAG: Tll0287-like domain-containing protein [Nitrospirota bacterium]
MRETASVVALVLIVVGAAGSPAGLAADADQKKVRAQEIAHELLSLRSALARTFISADTEVTEQTFQRVCAPVGARAKELAAQEGIVIRQTAIKNRNPAHAATLSEVAVLEGFLKDPAKQDQWDQIEMDGKSYQRYMRRIDVEEPCLRCHGPKTSRPEFLAKKYPEDKAFDFGVGDLRGAIVVMVPTE